MRVDRQHLLLTTGKIAGQLSPSFEQAWDVVENLSHALAIIAVLPVWPPTR